MQPLRIESLSNPVVKGLRALRTPKGRDEQRLFLAEGERTIATATAAGWVPEMLLTAGPLRAPIDGGASHARESFSVTTEVLAKITGNRLGNMWRVMMCQLLAPRARPRST